MEQPLKIRAHHLLCLQGFQGYGYSKDFVANLRGIRDHLLTSPHLEIQVVAEEDIICSCCPHRSETGCGKNKDSELRIRAKDLKILEKLDVVPGTQDLACNFLERIAARFRTYWDIQDICGNCQWEDKCLWYQRMRPL